MQKYLSIVAKQLINKKRIWHKPISASVYRGNRRREITNFSVGHPKPEKILVKIKEGKGVLLKESYNPGWLARVNGKKSDGFQSRTFPDVYTH